jgi:hypothetical protein
MSGLTNYGEDLLVTWMFTTSAATRPTAWFVALHTGDPGETGASSEVTVGTDADYVRKAITFADPVASSGQILSDAQVSWTVAAGSSGYTVTHASIWDAVTGGNCLMKGQLPVQRVLAANGVLTFAVGEVVAAMD